LWDD
jgi:hypothetical protein